MFLLWDVLHHYKYVTFLDFDPGLNVDIVPIVYFTFVIQNLTKTVPSPSSPTKSRSSWFYTTKTQNFYSCTRWRRTNVSFDVPFYEGPRTTKSTFYNLTNIQQRTPLQLGLLFLGFSSQCLRTYEYPRRSPYKYHNLPGQRLIRTVNYVITSPYIVTVVNIVTHSRGLLFVHKKRKKAHLRLLTLRYSKMKT